MSREIYGIEKGLRIYAENSQSVFIDVIFGSAAPGGDAAEQDAAALGSLYVRQNGGSSTLYQKVGSSNAPSDWQENGSSSAAVGTWRGEKVIAVTNDTVTAGVARDLVASPFADDEGTTLVAADFQVGQFIIADADGTPVLLEVTAVSAPNVTFSTPVSAPALSADDTFVTRNYLPDSPADQEGQAIVNYNGSVIIKVGDIDWNFADGIGTVAPTVVAPADPAFGTDSVQIIMEKLDQNNDAQDTLLGTAQGDTDLSTFSGVTIPDSSSVKGALQALETAYEETDQNVDDLITLSGMPENSTDFGTFTGAVLSDNADAKTLFQELESKDEAQDVIITEIDGNVDDLISLSGVAENSTVLGAFVSPADLLLTATETIKSALQKLGDFLGGLRVVEVTGITTEVSVDEVPVADASACRWFVEAFEEATPANKQALVVYGLNNGVAVQDSISDKLKVGSNFNLTISVDISGGNMRLRAASSTAGVTVRARRIEVTNI